MFLRQKRCLLNKRHKNHACKLRVDHSALIKTINTIGAIKLPLPIRPSSQIVRVTSFTLVGKYNYGA
ncbi:hypothetical protein ESA_00317 [Cronobacter sakazakii ATCC BAA-894]|uniref:Uncharacterized protein n=1 Tax=Cronobacter sakazakii (strain ATCC BAA-894) TaxID=290339 RepID=A7MLY8_CROS8|nr:hypothetical protein ESA_00317 [Cronobacter sakazakii ATCC BAA-894]